MSVARRERINDKQVLLVSYHRIGLYAHAVSEGETCLGKPTQLLFGVERRGFRGFDAGPALASTGKTPLHSG